jgi:hypothetical protein
MKQNAANSAECEPVHTPGADAHAICRGFIAIDQNASLKLSKVAIEQLMQRRQYFLLAAPQSIHFLTIQHP